VYSLVDGLRSRFTGGESAADGVGEAEPAGV
jgi:hypothetical protein